VHIYCTDSVQRITVYVLEMIKIVSILFIVFGLLAGDQPERKRLPRKGIIYSFTGCTVNYDLKVIWCVA
jgi:hypothetical protein